MKPFPFRQQTRLRLRFPTPLLSANRLGPCAEIGMWVQRGQTYRFCPPTEPEGDRLTERSINPA